MILTITMNPTINKTTSIEWLIPEKKLRCAELTVEPGGGGINASKAIKELGGKSMALFPSGGVNGKQLEDLLKENGICFQAISVKAQTRESFTITEAASNAQYRFVMPESSLTEAEIEACLEAIKNLQPVPTIIVAGGSLPAGTPDDFLASIALMSTEIDAKCVIDTSGKPLHLAAQEGVYLLKRNLSELYSLVGKEYLELHDVDEAAHEAIQKGHCEVIVVSLGPAEAILVTDKIHERIPAPTVKKLSTVGAGDSMVGSMAWMLEQGATLTEVVRFGVACGTAATMNPGTRLFQKEDVFRLYNWVNHHSRKQALAFEREEV